jgi:hypothetical protein
MIHCRKPKDTSRLYLIMAEAHIEICPKQFEHDVKAKHLAKACECLNKALKLFNVNQFEPNCIEDHEYKISHLVQKSIIDKCED